MDNHMMRELLLALKVYYHDADEAQKIILDSALVAAGADAVGSFIPGLAIPITIVGCTGAVWVMYKRLCDKLGISLSGKVLKLLARAAVANIAANLGGAFLALIAGLLVPGASIAASAIVSFLTVYLAGFIFLKLILGLAQKSADPYTFSDISTSEMKREVEQTKVSKEDLEAAKQVYEENKENVKKDKES